MKGIRLGGLAAGLFAAGLVTGLAGTAVARDAASTAGCDAHMAEHRSDDGSSEMMSMMGGATMGDPIASMGPDRMGGEFGPGGAPMPGGRHQEHHPLTSPRTTR